MSDQASQLRRMVRAVAETEASSAGDGGVMLLDHSWSASVPTGVVSYRPQSQRRRHEEEVDRPARLARAIAVTSGKGGVGKSNVAVNLAVTLSQMGRKVCLLDADFGMANVDVLCNISPKLTLQHVVAGRCSLRDVVLIGPGGFRLIPGASGVTGMADLTPAHRRMLLQQFAALERVADVLIIDCAAGISQNVIAFASAAHSTLLVTTPEPPALTDAYGMVKSLVRVSPQASAQLLVNMTSSREEAVQVHERMNRVTQSFLRRSVGFAGAIPADPAVAAAVRHRMPFTLHSPESPAARAIRSIAASMTGHAAASSVGGRHGFFARLAGWFRSS